MTLGCFLLAGVGLAAQEVAKQRVKAVRELGKGGSGEISRIEPFLTDPDLDVRLEAVKAIIDIGTQTSLNPLIKATADNDAEVQIRATDGLVNFYVPGYVKTGLTAPLRRMGTSIKSRFTETNDQVIDSYIQVRPEIIEALGRLVRGGASMESRANAARATGILRGRQALPELEQALHSKDTPLIYECLIAIQKIRDPSAGASIIFLVHDLDERVQIAAIETTGLLMYHEGINDLRDVLDRSKNMKVKRAALTSMAELPDEQMHGVYIAHLNDKDDGLREGAAEGLARLKNPADRTAVENAFSNERKTGPRLSLAFALVSMGKREMGEFDPLKYLLDNLNSSGYKGVARPYLTELARDPEVRAALYTGLQDPTATKDEKLGLAQILAQSGDRDSIPALERLSKDSDQEVAQEGLRGLKNLRARLP
ncbi:MAG TPA: HEAT repeat domain-containing protein [Bryobacteraceae bacterium]|jgi:HEAT repeat protein|nr:HEAT repeat domain-containing protein [Bryobacteraceae bacterium]